MQELTISVAELLGRPGAVRDVRLTARLEGIATALARVSAEPVALKLRVESVMEGILVTGRLEAGATAQCARCLTNFPVDAGVEVCELFVAPGHEAGDDDVYKVGGTEIDLEPMVRDALMLTLPFHPICREECKGICARCGADLNAGECSCTEAEEDPRWAPLEALREQLEQRGTA